MPRRSRGMRKGARPLAPIGGANAATAAAASEISKGLSPVLPSGGINKGASPCSYIALFSTRCRSRGRHEFRLSGEMIPWIGPGERFPPVERALREPNGLLAAGADLSPQRLIAAYRQGIFPWYSAGEPILWWSPDPRMVLRPAELRISRSLAKRLRRGECRVRLDSAFRRVLEECAAPRRDGAGTWITREMRAAYLRLHELGYAHSVESYVEDELVGGLYGVALGRAFYGESMFARRTDASKIALAHLARYLEARGFHVIDCQMSTPHLASLGAREMPRREFVRGLARWAQEGGEPGRWPADDAAHLFCTAP